MEDVPSKVDSSGYHHIVIYTKSEANGASTFNPTKSAH